MSSALWPVHAHEHRKVLPMIALSFLVCFNYTMLRDLKDILVMQKMDTVAVLWLQLGLTLPASIAVMLAYTSMTTKFSKSTIFYSLLGAFIIFFALFGMIIYPLSNLIQPGEPWVRQFIDITQKDVDSFIKKNGVNGVVPIVHDSNGFPQSVVPLMSIIAYWPTALLYVVSELWGTVVLSLLFWGFANDICTTEEAKRFYTLFNIGANFSLIFSGSLLIGLGAMKGNIVAPVEGDGEGCSMYVLMALVVLFGTIIIAIYRWMQLNVVSDPQLCPPKAGLPTNKAKVKLGLAESLRVIFTSSYIALIGLIVMIYGIAVNFLELYYKDAWRFHFGQRRGDIMMFQGGFSLCTGIVSLNLLIFVGGRAVRGIGWTNTALISPGVIIINGLPFLILYMIDYFAGDVFPLPLIVAFGFLAVVLSKASKYSFFDPTKEMAFIPLGDGRGRAKAAVDVVGVRIGKSLGSILQILLTVIYSTRDVKNFIYIIATLLCAIVIAWAYSVVKLGRMYESRIKATDHIDLVNTPSGKEDMELVTVKLEEEATPQ